MLSDPESHHETCRFAVAALVVLAIVFSICATVAYRSRVNADLQGELQRERPEKLWERER